MVLDYYPMDMERTYKFFYDGNISTEEIIYGLISNNYCKYVNKQGKTAGNICLKKIRHEKNSQNKNIYCHFHRYQEKICKIKICNKKCKRGYNICNKHFKYQTKISDDIDHYEDAIYNSKYEMILFNNINFKIFNYINLNGIYKICNEYMLQKYFFEHKSIFESFENNPIIKYNKFDIIDHVYSIYNKFKNKIYYFINKYKINATFLHYILSLIKEINEKKYSNDIILYYNYQKYIFNKNVYIYINDEKHKMYNYIKKLYNMKFHNVFNILLKSNKNNQIIIYDNVFKKKIINYINNKKEKTKIKADIKIEYFYEGKKYGIPIYRKRKSPFPNSEIVIDNIIYINCYYEFDIIKKEVRLYCKNKKKQNKIIFVYTIKQFENMLKDIYTKDTVDKYFDYIT